MNKLNIPNLNLQEFYNYKCFFCNFKVKDFFIYNNKTFTCACYSIYNDNYTFVSLNSTINLTIFISNLQIIYTIFPENLQNNLLEITDFNNLQYLKTKTKINVFFNLNSKEKLIEYYSKFLYIY